MAPQESPRGQSASVSTAVPPPPSAVAAAGTPRRGAARREALCTGASTPHAARSSAFRSNAAKTEGEEPLDITAVEYASRACGAIANWVVEVLREFFVLRRLRAHRQAASLKLDAWMESSGLRAREESVAQMQEEICRIQEELVMWHTRVHELKQRELEAERARGQLLALSHLEERRAQPAGKKLEAIPKKQELVQLEMHAKRKQAMKRMQKKTPRSENGAWPPRGKYLHVMSSPTCSASGVLDEVSTDEWQPVSPVSRCL